MSDPVTSLPVISVIIPHYDQKPALCACLAALCAQEDAPPFEIIVGDNDTPGGISGIAAAFPEVQFVTVAERGAAPARNGALAKARGRVIAFTDADCVPHRHWLKEGAAALERGKGDLIGGEVLVTYADPAAPKSVELFEQVFGFRQRMYVQKRKFSVTANLFTRADVMAATGPFTNGVPEDMDWCHRASRLGFRLSFHGKSKVSHPARASWSDLQRKWERLIAERWQAHGDRVSSRYLRDALWVMLAVATLLSAVPHTIKVLATPKLSGGKQRLAAASVLWRIRVWRCQAMIRELIAGRRRVDSPAIPARDNRRIKAPRRA